MKRYAQLWLVRFGAAEPREPGKDRPAIIVSIDALPAAIRAVSRARLLRYIGDVPEGTQHAVEQALRVVLGLD